MSRTYRKRKNSKKKFYNKEWVLRSKFYTETELSELNFNDIETINISHVNLYTGMMYTVSYKHSSEYGKAKLAKWHSDNGVYNFKEPGPKWYKNLFTIRPERRRTKRELHKYIKNEEYEVQVYSKYYYEYYT